MKRLFTLLVTALILAPQAQAGLKVSGGAELTKQEEYVVVRAFELNNSPITLYTMESRRGSLGLRLNIGYEAKLTSHFGLDLTTSVDSYLKNRTELMGTVQVTDEVTIKAGPSYSTHLDNKELYADKAGVTVGGEVKIDEKMFVDIKAHFSDRTRVVESVSEITYSESQVFVGIGVRF